jgi:alanine racemase
MYLAWSEMNPEAKVALTDSRFLTEPGKSIFFAIRGERHDGHRFIPKLFEAGIREFVVEKGEKPQEVLAVLERKEVKAFEVESSIRALQGLAAARRSKFSYPVVGITGSNGKTIVKEWLNTLLERDFDIVKSPRSYNSQIGVALSVWEMNRHHTLGIFEAGISQAGEMVLLENMVRPTVGIFTNIGSSHSEGFSSEREKIREKLQLFTRAEALVYCRDHGTVAQEIQDYLLPLNPSLHLISWSTSSINYLEGKVNVGGEQWDLPFKDPASLENAMHSAHAARYVKPDLDLTALRFLNPVEMRLELKEGREDNYLIDDTYNNDFGGLKMALNFMSQAHTLRDKVVILSDILQTGWEASALSRKLSEILAPQNIKHFIGVGPMLQADPPELPGVKVELFPSTAALIESGVLEEFQKSLILVKGARIYSFEQVVDRLIKRVHGTVLEINLDAVTHNLNYYRKRVGADTKLMVMVKAFAYGSGNEVAAWLQYHRVDYLTVAYPDEGVALRENGIRLPIMVMNADPDSYSTVFEHDLEPEIYSFRVLEAYLKAKSAWNPEVITKIHLKVDTGMHRLGFLEKDVSRLLDRLGEVENVQVASIFSHLVGADDAEHDGFSRQQIACFERASAALVAGLGYAPLRHICNTAGIVRFPEAKYDMVRLGIGLYGVASSGLEQGDLQTVATLKTTISQIKTLDQEETVGYGRFGVLHRTSRIATIALGYADGYDRGLGRGVGAVEVNGVLCPTVGNVCMDMCMIDVTDVDCEEGDEVVVFGKRPTLRDLSQAIQTIPYEVLTGVSTRVKRVFYHA